MKQILLALITLLLCSADAFTQSTDSSQISQSVLSFPPKKINNPFHNLDRQSAKAFTLLNDYETSFSLYYNPTGNASARIRYSSSQRGYTVREIVKMAGQIALSAYAGKNNVRYTSPGQ